MPRDAVAAAFAVVRREDFLPRAQRRFAGEDRPLPIGHGQTNSQPSTVRAMLELLEVSPGMRVLDVGSGSGWTTALLGVLVGPSGRVLGVERVPELVADGGDNLAAYGMSWTSITAAEPGVLGLPGEAPFDRVLVSAEAASLPEPLVEQLTPTGLLVAPVAGRMTTVRLRAGRRETESHGFYSFVPLLGS